MSTYATRVFYQRRGVLLDETMDQPTTFAGSVRGARRRGADRRLRRQLAQALDPPSAAETTGSSSAVLTVESSQQNAITQNFNPFIQSSAASAARRHVADLRAAAADQRDQARPVLQLAGHRLHWANGGKSITFTIRPGVKWSDGTPMTAADVAFTFNMLKKYPDVNTTGLADHERELERQPGRRSTSPRPQYTNLQNIAARRTSSRSRSGARSATRASTPTRTRSARARTASRSSPRRASR